jgi:N-methylhydantoinase A
MSQVRIGIDVGGTFTDFVLHDQRRGLVRTGKRLTTPDAPSVAIIAGIERLLRETGTTAADIHSIVHGTTLITNTIIERTGSRVGLIATAGFRDAIEMGREIRYDLYDLFLEPPPTLVPRYCRLEVRERISANGTVLLPLDEPAVADAARRLVQDEGVDAIAIAFLHSYRNRAHERRAGAIIRELYPDLPLTLSSEVAPEIREFERTSTAVANAYVQPRVQGYLDRLTAELRQIGFAGELYVMLSSGGISTVEDAKTYPIRLIESGPAAGAISSSEIARKTGERRVISFDMGGTTAKMCLIEDLAPDHKFDFEAARVRRFKKGSGLPLKVSVVDMIEIGAGGGSMARCDAIGLMKVGPQSAGSQPGPVCYGRGGTFPTVTDADLLLGYLNAEYFLGGEMKLRLEDVQAAVSGTLAERLGLSTTMAASGIRHIVNENMAAATRMHMAEKGRDPRDYTMVAFGGAGPVHAYDLAKLLKLKRVIVPPGAGVASALGFLVAAPGTDDVRGYVTRLDTCDWDAVNGLYEEMSAAARRLLVAAGAQPHAIRISASADMRHVGQGFEIRVPIPPGKLEPASLPAIRKSFFTTYAALFDRTIETVPIEALNWRMHATAPGHEISIDYARPTTVAPLRSRRKVLLDGREWTECDVYDRTSLAVGQKIYGPAVIEERESTCIVGADGIVSVDDHLNLVIEITFETTAAPQSLEVKLTVG